MPKLPIGHGELKYYGLKFIENSSKPWVLLDNSDCRALSFPNKWSAMDLFSLMRLGYKDPSVQTPCVIEVFNKDGSLHRTMKIIPMCHISAINESGPG